MTITRAQRAHLRRAGILFLALGTCALTHALAAAPGSCRPDPDGPVVQQRDFAVATSSEYILPYEAGTTRLVWRTASHFTPGNGGVGLYAVDLRMPIGTPILAARAGEVVAVRDSFTDGSKRDLEENFVMIRYADASVARYVHPKHAGVLVKPGQQVRQGERIALSGNTGETGGPHLHFDVQKCGLLAGKRYRALPL